MWLMAFGEKEGSKHMQTVVESRLAERDGPD